MISTLIQFNIEKTCVSPIRLKDLIKTKTGCNFDQSNLNLKITLINGVSIELIDDTISFEDLHGTQSVANGYVTRDSVVHDIEFVLSESSKLLYTCNLKPVFDSEYDQAVLQKLGDCDVNLDKRLVLNLSGINAHAKARIRCLAFSAQNIKFKTIQNHLSSDTFSCLCIKNVLFDAAKIECDNKIIVPEDVCKSFANQMNHNLIIGANAHVISRPSLEIENDDVKCKHGVATKTIDEEQLFYLQGRGIDSVVAKQLLIKGFLG